MWILNWILAYTLLIDTAHSRTQISIGETFFNSNYATYEMQTNIILFVSLFECFLIWKKK